MSDDLKCEWCGWYADHDPRCKQASDTPTDDEAPSKPSCGGCRFYLLTAEGSRGGPSGGECRREPPRMDPEGLAAWPMLASNNAGCGHRSPRDEPEPEDDDDTPFRQGPMPGPQHGPAMPPRRRVECPCDGVKLRTGQKAHLASCKLQYLGSEDGYQRSLIGAYHQCREPGCENSAFHSMLCKTHGGVPLIDRPSRVITGKLVV